MFVLAMCGWATVDLHAVYEWRMQELVRRVTSPPTAAFLSPRRLHFNSPIHHLPLS
jgi:hypothetical protein